MFSVVRYAATRQTEWDSFVRGSRNATFLFERGYMDYHADRFEDYSLMIYKENALCAVLPANLLNDNGELILQSHGGLTYGGLILPPRHLDASDILEIFFAIKGYCKGENIIGLDYKAIPFIYCSMPSQEDLYAIQRMDGVMKQGNLSCCIDLEHNPGFNTQQKRNLKRAVKGGFKIEILEDVSEFHALLSLCLSERFCATPVHTLEELRLLADRYPENIRFIGVRSSEDGLIAAVCLYVSEMVVHTQYICSSAAGRDHGALTMLFANLTEYYTGKVRYFDFGTSNGDGGRYLNPGLYHQKSGLGGSGVSYPRFYLDFTC